MRHDHQVIKNIHKLYGAKLALNLQKLPFFYINEEVENCFASYQQRNAEGYKKQFPEYEVRLLDFEEIGRIMPFPMVVVMDHDIGWQAIDWKGNGKWSVTLCIDRMLNDMGINVPPGALLEFDLVYSPAIPGEKQSMLSIDGSLLINEGTNRLEGLPVDMQNRLFKMVATNHEFLGGMSKHLTRNLHYFLSFFKWAEGMHMVEVKKSPNQEDLKQKAKGYKKPWLRSDLPHYVYLDAPKTVRDSSGTYVSGDPTHSVRGHNRRAHWRSLTNPRFKNHPMYGKRIRVKATWVGPTEWTVGDTIYTVKGDMHVSDIVPSGSDSPYESTGAVKRDKNPAIRVEYSDLSEPAS